MALTAPSPFVEAMAKHLPPSASTLRLADVGGAAGDILRHLRGDLEIIHVTGTGWTLEENSVDAVAAYGGGLDPALLQTALAVLRPGGRLIVVDPQGAPEREHVQTLEAAGFTRILVEAALHEPALGVLVRGEKPHVTADTLARVQSVAQRDSAAPDLVDFKGRYLHLLVRQTPNKPVWALSADERVSWEALAVEQENDVTVLAFSSLPNAVAFMQAAVLAGTLRDVNKVGKFSRKTAEGWSFRFVINSPPDILRQQRITRVSIDPATAETGEE
jgi:hypothetical protein